MRRALFLTAVLFAVVVPLPSAKAATVVITISSGQPSPNPATITAGDDVKWHNSDDADHTVILEDGRSVPVPAGGNSDSTLIEFSEDYIIDDELNGIFSIAVEEPATTTTSTTQPTTTTTKPTTTTSSTTTSTSSTTTTSSSTTTTTTVFSSASAPITIEDKGSGGGSSALPLILGALVIVAGLAGLAYWLWLRSTEPYEDDGPDWTEEPPPTVQGPRL